MKKLWLALAVFLLCGISVSGQQQQPDVKLFIDSAEHYFGKRKFAEAIVEITKAIEIEPKNADLFIWRAGYYSYLKDKDAVLRNVKTALSLASGDTQILKDGATWLLLSGHFEESLKIGNSLVSLDEGNPAGYIIRSRSLFRLKDYGSGLENYFKALELKPHSYEIGHGFLFESLKNLKDDKNISDYYSRAYNLLEKIHRDANEKTQTNSSDLKVDEIRARSVVIMSGDLLQLLSLDWTALYEKKGETRKAEELLDKMVQFEPRLIAYSRRAKHYRRNGKPEEAGKDEIKVIEISIEEITKILRLENAGVEYKANALLRRGDLYVRLNQFDKAIADYEKAISLNPGVREEAAKRIDSAREKARENPNQPN
ncbi:MAG TPA: tetratricopeptide repeat protein [Pyrinomonadaceae bacterium]|nr:tetratricopeptide repeat protein [Pyrinomonadaceae bacterium]